MKEQKHIMTMLVDNKPGVLSRVVGLFSGKGFNIESLAVGETEEHAISRLTVVVGGNDAILEQVRKQLGKVVEVMPAKIDEAMLRDAMMSEGATPRDVADALAEAKARKTAEKAENEAEKALVEARRAREELDRLREQQAPPPAPSGKPAAARPVARRVFSR